MPDTDTKESWGAQDPVKRTQVAWRSSALGKGKSRCCGHSGREVGARGSFRRQRTFGGSFRKSLNTWRTKEAGRQEKGRGEVGEHSQPSLTE